MPKGYHVIHISAHGVEVERSYQVVKSKLHEITINLVWERRQNFVLCALERPVDDAAADMTKPPFGSDAMITSNASATAASDVQKSSVGIEISLEDTPIVALLSVAAAPVPRTPRPILPTSATMRGAGPPPRPDSSTSDLDLNITRTQAPAFALDEPLDLGIGDETDLNLEDRSQLFHREKKH